MDAVDRNILALLIEDARRSFGDLAHRVSLSAPSVKRRVDRMRAQGVIEGFTAIVAHDALGDTTEALVELFYAPGTQLEDVAERLREYSEVVEAWSVTGEADAIARVRTQDNSDLERLIIDLQRHGPVERTRSQVVLSRLVARGVRPRPRPARGVENRLVRRERAGAQRRLWQSVRAGVSPAPAPCRRAARRPSSRAARPRAGPSGGRRDRA